MLQAELQAVDQTLNDFACATQRLSAAWFGSGLVTSHGRQEFRTAAADVHNSARAFADAYAQAVPIYRTSFASLLGRTDPTGPEFIAAQLAMTQAGDPCVRAIKLFVFANRIYQDTVYRIYLETSGEKAGSGSMSTGVKEGSPMRALLDIRCPGYVEWFIRTRKLRDRLKRGLDFSPFSMRDRLVFNEVGTNETGIEFTAAEAGPRTFTIEDVIESVGLSTEVTDAVAREAPRSGRADQL
jgi:hypothetical protein